jgi:hypothetical protein
VINPSIAIALLEQCCAKNSHIVKYFSPGDTLPSFLANLSQLHAIREMEVIKKFLYQVLTIKLWSYKNHEKSRGNSSIGH